jgi:hypothetical protein
MTGLLKTNRRVDRQNVPTIVIAILIRWIRTHCEDSLLVFCSVIDDESSENVIIIIVATPRALFTAIYAQTAHSKITWLILRLSKCWLVRSPIAYV